MYNVVFASTSNITHQSKVVQGFILTYDCQVVLKQLLHLYVVLETSSLWVKLRSKHMYKQYNR